MRGMIHVISFIILLDYRDKRYSICNAKYGDIFQIYETRKVFDDLLGFRTLCDDYDFF